jgi:hypothetical protein
VTAPVVFAHAGHWAVDAAFTAPVCALVVWFWIVSIRDRRRRKRGEGP